MPADAMGEIRHGTADDRAVTIVDPDPLTDLLRKLLTEIVHESPPTDRVAQPREGQRLVSATLHSSNSTFTHPLSDIYSGSKRR